MSQKKPKILIIEDEAFLIDMYEMKFKQDGYEVLRAMDAMTGIELAKSTRPDLILLDIVMPGTSGFEVLKELKGQPEYKSIPILIFSNLGQKEEIDQGLALGANGYIVKSDLTPRQLVEKVGDMLGRKGRRKSPKRIIIADAVEKNNLGGNGENGQGIKILLFEDEDAIIDMYRAKMAKEGFQLRVARNGAWGLKLAQEDDFDLILLDMVMPAMTGYEAIKALKKNPKTKKIPFIVLSNSAQEGEIKKALQMGARAYFLKSQVTPSVVIDKVREVLKL
jgi:CheY-like chemotaxis protein